MRTIAVVSLKGGSGKTTVAAHLALAGHFRGMNTLAVDIDPQHSCDDLLSARETPGPQSLTATAATLLSAQFGAVGSGKDLMIIDTAAGALEDASEALVLADFAVMVVRPTLLDLAGLARTLRLVNRLKKPAVVVINQAPAMREIHEPPMVKRALSALDYMQAAVAPVILRSRIAYQTALERGRSVEEMADHAAAAEMIALWEYVDERLKEIREGTAQDEQIGAQA